MQNISVTFAKIFLFSKKIIFYILLIIYVYNIEQNNTINLFSKDINYIFKNFHFRK